MRITKEASRDPAHRRSSILLVSLLTGLIFFSTQAISEKGENQEGVYGFVESINKYGHILIEGEVPLRLWGLQVDPAKLRVAIEGMRLYCYPSGATRRVLSMQVFDIKAVECVALSSANDNVHLDTILGEFGGHIANYLLKRDWATEICSETLNIYGTCRLAGGLNNGNNRQSEH